MSAPLRLIDPEGEGVYVLAGTMADPNSETSLLRIALEFFGDARQWRDIDYANAWMHEREDGLWYPVRRRWWNGFRRARHQPTLYAYLTPKPDAM